MSASEQPARTVADEPAVRRRSTRDRPAKAPLSEDAVIDAALEILKTEGLEAVTMRHVAKALDTGAASLYVYVSGREGLLQGMLDRVASLVELEQPDPERWRDQLRSLLRRMHVAFTAHPGIAAITLGDPPNTDAILAVAENLLGILLAGGLSVQDAAWACDLCTLLVTAVATEDDAWRAEGRSDDDRRREVDEMERLFAGLPPERFPLLAAHAIPMVTGDGDDRFNFALDVIIDGLLARNARA